MVVSSIHKRPVCKAQAAKKQCCRNRMAHAKICWVHFKTLQCLHVKKSTHGFGLFAAHNIHKHKIVVPYKGGEMTKRQVAKRYPKKDDHYVICLHMGDRCIDMHNTTSGIGKYADSASGMGKKANAHFADCTH